MAATPSMALSRPSAVPLASLSVSSDTAPMRTAAELTAPTFSGLCRHNSVLRREAVPFALTVQQGAKEKFQGYRGRRAGAGPRGGALAASASMAPKKILMMGGTRFIGVYLARELVKQGHEVTLFTRGKAAVTSQIPGESDADFAAYSSKVHHIKGDRMDFDAVRAALKGSGFQVVYDINGREAAEVEPIVDALPGLEQSLLTNLAEDSSLLVAGMHIGATGIPWKLVRGNNTANKRTRRAGSRW